MHTTTPVALQSRSISQTYILDSGPRRIALLPAHLHGGSSTCCSGSGSLHVSRVKCVDGLVEFSVQNQ